MQVPLQITIKDIESSPAIEDHIREKADKLSHYFEQIISCHIVIELVQKNQNVGKLYRVHITLYAPGKELVATKNRSENLWIAIRDAFDDMYHQLKAYSDQMQRQVKSHAELLHGEVIRKIDDFGFILGPDGITEYYFNSTNVVYPNFDKLEVGTPVHFIPFMGDEGPQARRVSAKRHS